jgi:hypothetical protein
MTISAWTFLVEAGRELAVIGQSRAGQNQERQDQEISFQHLRPSLTLKPGTRAPGKDVAFRK